MKKLLFLFLVAGVAACNPNENATETGQNTNSDVLVRKTQLIQGPSGPAYKPEAVSQMTIDIEMRDHDFKWENQDIQLVWSATKMTGLLAVGYQPAGFTNIDKRISTINIHSAEWKNVHDALIARVLKTMSTKMGRDMTASEIISEDHAVLPQIIFKVTDPDVLTDLLNLENVRYAEPYGYYPLTADAGNVINSSSGCSGSSYSLNAADYTTITPGCKQSWNYTNVNIPAAWNSYHGENIKIGVIDAGISSTQPLLNAQFNSGSSSGRTITTGYTYSNSAYTTCAHGSSMCGLAAGPRNSLGNACGVAYQSNLYFIRACNDVVLDESAELSGVRNALIAMGNTVDLNIISMSVGTPFSSSVLRDGVNYASGKGKLIFAAAGTSFSWTSWWGVIYPAAYSGCVAVTGVKESGSTCYDCHDGSQVRITIPMERNTNSNRTSVSLPVNGNNPTYVGGSSCATAITAGIAALVWSAKPTLTAAQVLDCIYRTSQYYPTLTGTHGYGNPNAAAACALAATL